MNKKRMLLFLFVIGIMFSVIQTFGSPMYVNAKEEDIYDIVLFWGQSNMRGSVGGSEEEKQPDKRILVEANTGIAQEILNVTTAMNHVNVPIQEGTAYEYRYSLRDKNPLVPIESSTSTIGETLAYQDGAIVAVDSSSSAQASKGTNMIPQFCDTYYRMTGHKVIAVMVAVSGRELSAFLPASDSDNEYLDSGINKTAKIIYQSAVDYANENGYQIGSKFWVSFQGESDVRNMNGNSDVASYVDKFNMLSKDLADSLGTEFGFIVETGFIFSSDWKSISSTTIQRVERVNQAQEKIIETNENIMLGSDFPYRQYMAYNDNVVSNYDNYVHFTSAALSQVGYDTAMKASNYVNGGFVESITLDCSEKTISPNESFQLVPSVMPDSTLNDYLVWTSTDPHVAAVDENGMVTGIKEGAVLISVRTKNGEKQAVCKVIVKGEGTNTITLKESDISLKTGETYSLNVTSESENVKWSCDNLSVAKVEQGIVTGVGEGTAFVSVVEENSGRVATCKVTVTDCGVMGVTLPESMDVQVGMYALLNANVIPEAAQNRKLQWESSDPSLLFVDENNGLMKGLKEGDATITVTTLDGGYQSSCIVHILPDTRELIPVNSVLQMEYDEMLVVGENRQLSVTCLPEDGTDQTLCWLSSDDEIAKVSQEGIVTGCGIGQVVITAVAANGIDDNVKTAFTLQVSDSPIEEITFEKPQYKLSLGGKCKINPVIVPETAFVNNLEYVSSDTDIFSVDENGEITGNSVGSGELLVRTMDGNISATCIVEIVAPAISNITFDCNELVLEVGQEKVINASVIPGDIPTGGIVWNSSDSSVVEVTQDGKVIGKKCGTAMVVASSMDGNGVLACCHIVVQKQTIKARLITVSCLSNEVRVDATNMMHAQVMPSNTTNKDVVWTSSNPYYAVVCQNGLIKGKRPGMNKTVVITAKAKDGSSVYGKFQIKVVPKYVEQIHVLNPIGGNKLAVGKSVAMKLVVTPVDATEKTVKWTSSNTKYATVDGNGVVTAKQGSNGKKVTITASATDGSKVYGSFDFIIMKHEVTAISLSAQNNKVFAGRTLQINSLMMSTGPNVCSSLKWTSSNPEYASVDSKGIITGNKAGIGKIVTITATSKDGSNVKATYKVKVVQK
ncbi:MAG: Ig-like domain-containing protein [Lachnospiraceae bacterium]